MVLQLVREGRNFLNKGQIVRARDVSKQISTYLDFYIVPDEDWVVVQEFFNEVSMMQNAMDTLTQKDSFF